ncbi:MAG: hypothetical protein ACD_71C00215G0003 [uncultured bacterium (gcode 4)]|uniref:Uncharacterized protein n=1 Tax=uncultured bacterium (gcode 4) TaxID=1234023 RepID=K1Z4N1_9BACT|nr:MAG: hypothetical protein ACD_71C00215G0003 [uncultured bacterium (gcode 4)]
MKKLSPFLLNFVIFCIFQYILVVFYYSSEGFKSKNCDYPWVHITLEQIEGIFPPDTFIRKKGELSE